jgi:hypothetical protein
MEMQKVKSSNLAAIGYDPDKQELVVRFHSGTQYRYHSVPPEVHEAFLGAKSMGIFFVRNVKGCYDTEKL